MQPATGWKVQYDNAADGGAPNNINAIGSYAVCAKANISSVAVTG